MEHFLEGMCLRAGLRPAQCVLLWQAHTVVGLEDGCEYIAGHAMDLAVTAIVAVLLP